MADINPVLQAANKASAIAGDAGTELNSGARAQFDLYKTVAGLFERQGNNAAIVESAKQSGELETQAAADLAASNLGTDLRLPANRLNGLNDELLRSMGIRDQALAAVNEKQRVGLFENPLSWLLNQITVNDDIAEYNAANAEVNNASEKIATLTRATDSQVATQKAIKHSVTTASAAAAADNTKILADINAAQANVSAWEVNAKGIERAVTMSNAEVANKNAVFHAQLSAEEAARSSERLGLERTRAGFDEEQRAFQRQMWDEQLAVKKDVRAAKEELLATVNIGLRAIGSEEIKNPGTIARFMLSAEKTGNVPDEFLDAFKRGRATLQAGEKVIAPDPANLFNLLRTTNIKWVPAQAPVKAALQEIAKDVATLSAQPNGPKKQADIDAALNKRTDEVFDAYRNKIIPGDKDNPYNVGSISDVIKSGPVANLPVVIKVLAPLTATPEGALNLDDPAKLTSLVFEAVVAGKISLNDAAELPLVYGRAVAINNEVKQFKTLGLKENPTYNIKLQAGFSSVTDLANKDQWTRYLNKQLAQSMRLESLGALTGN